MWTRRDLISGRGPTRVAAAEQPQPPLATRRSGPEYFSNAVLTTHEGKTVRFYDDLIRGKVVLINMMYAQCDGICPTMTDNLVRVQQLLGPRVGRDIFMYSITLQPEQDSPQDLKIYAAVHGVKPGWLFLTGQPADLRFIRYRLGFYDPDPVIDGDKATHTGAVRIGNDAYERWAMAPALTGPEHILATINHVDRTAVYTAPGRINPSR
jgi:protein SCO1/2